MKPSLRLKLDQLSSRLAELNHLLAAENATRDMDRYRALSKEHADIDPVVARFHEFMQAEADLEAANEFGSDPEMKALADEERASVQARLARIVGDGVYAKLKFESGGHRVQRVPETEAQGRIHTSACTVAVLAEADPVADIAINPADLRIDTFRASGAGGQHVNKTDSAVRLTHLPTGIVVECQDDRSQHRNRAQAMSVLASPLVEKERQE